MELTIGITSLGHHGHGIAEICDSRLYVPYTAPGEEVRVTATGSRGELLEIIRPSKDRTKPECVYFGSCGGCAVQHLKQDAYRAWKRNVVVQALRHKGLETQTEPLIDAHGAGRRRVTFHIARQGQGVQVGFMEAGTHRLTNVTSCPVLEPLVSRSIEMIRHIGERINVPRQGLDGQVTLSETGIDCDLRGVDDIGYDLHMTLAELAERHDLARLTLDGEMISERRKPQVTIGIAQVTLPVGGFLQATSEGERILAGLVCDYANEVNARSAADLFCGIGAYALRLAEYRPVFAADNSPASIESVSNAVRQTQGLKPVTTMTRDLFDNPVSVCELNEFDFIVFNPPRAGAKEQAASIAESSVNNVVAVSCDPATFARDARLLVEGGYHLERVIPIDQFRWAAHTELVGMFTRR